MTHPRYELANFDSLQDRRKQAGGTDCAFVEFMPEYYLEDLKVGDRFASAPYIVTEAAIIDFSREFDPQPLHLDAERAKETFLEGLTASGWHTAAITMRLFVTSDLNFVGGAIGLGVDELRWTRPVRPGDTLSIRVTVLEANVSRSKPDRGMVRTLIEVLNQNGELVMSCKAINLLKCRPSA